MNVVFGILFILEVFITLGVAIYSSFEENPFWCIVATWENTDDLNIVGKIICEILVTIVCFPAIALMCATIAVLFIIGAVATIFCWIFKKRG